MDQTGQQQAGASSKAGKWMAPIGALLLAWGVLGAVFATANGDGAAGLAYLVAVIGVVLLVGGLLLTNLRR